MVTPGLYVKKLCGTEVLQGTENGFQHSADNGSHLIRNQVTIVPFPPWINVSGFHFLLHLNTILQIPKERHLSGRGWDIHPPEQRYPQKQPSLLFRARI